jgi:hypothetical protein
LQTASKYWGFNKFLTFLSDIYPELACRGSQIHLPHEIEKKKKKNPAPYPLQLDDQSTRKFSQNWLLTRYENK